MKQLIKVAVCCIVPFFSGWRKFMSSTILPNNYLDYLKFRLGINKIYWPKDKTCLVTHPRKIYVGIKDWSSWSLYCRCRWYLDRRLCPLWS